MLDAIGTLSLCERPFVLVDETKQAAEKAAVGVACLAVTGSVTVRLAVGHLVDPTALIAKSATKLDKARAAAEKLEKQMAMPTYEAKVAQSARESNALELDKLRNEIASLSLSIKNFEKLKQKNEQAAKQQ